MNVDLWLERFDEHQRLSGFTERTREGYGLELNLFLRFLGDREIHEVANIRRQDVDAYRLRLHHWRKRNGEPLTLRTQGSKLGAVLSFLRYLHEAKLILVNPGHGVRL
jgi:integrase/recombinase XerD